MTYTILIPKLAGAYVVAPFATPFQLTYVFLTVATPAELMDHVFTSVGLTNIFYSTNRIESRKWSRNNETDYTSNEIEHVFKSCQRIVTDLFVIYWC